MRLLITGFPSFPGRPQNPSQALVEAVERGAVKWSEGLQVATALLPVEYAAIETEFAALLERFQPESVMAFGVGRQPALWRLERRAVNWNQAEIPDNAGELRQGVAIHPDGPQSVASKHDVDVLCLSLQSAGVPVEVSEDAGTYLCNHLMYVAFRAQSRSPVPFAFQFVHLAPPEFEFAMAKSLQSLPLVANWIQNQR